MAHSEGGERSPVGLAGGHLLAEVVGRQLNVGAAGRGRYARRLFRQRTADDQVTLAAELDDGAFGHLGRQRLTVPALPVLDLGEAAAFERAGEDDRRLSHAEVARLSDGLV